MAQSKLEANRANAQHSTGPRTEAGKARSAQNARTHGLTSRELVIHPGEQPLFDDFLQGYLEDLRPEGALEHSLAANIVHAAWNLRRIRLLDAQLCTGAADPLLDAQNEATLDRLARYSQRFERTLHRSLKELRTLQTERAARAAIPEPAVSAAPPLASTRELAAAKRTHFQARTDRTRASLADLDFEVTALSGRVPDQLLTSGVPRAHILPAAS